jgi:5-methylcytosine-specific restriction endonuclease McrA
MDGLAKRAADLTARIEAEGWTLHWHRRATVNLLFAAQGQQCCICRKVMRREQATIDHVKPKGRGGKDALENFLLAHEACNHARADTPADDTQLAILAKVHAALGLTPPSPSDKN